MKKYIFLTTAVILVGCSSKEPLVGKREAILETSFKDIGIEKDPSPVVLDPVQFNSDWTQPNFNAQNTYAPLMFEPSTNFSSFWSTSLDYHSTNDAKILSSPVIAEGKIFVVDAGGIVYALSQKNGDRIWRSSTTLKEKEGQLGCAIAYSQGKVIVSSSFGEVFAFNAANGKVLWRVKLSGICRGDGITIYNNSIYLLCADSSLHVLSLDDGKTLWTHMGVTPETSFIGGASVAVSEDIAYVAYPSGEVYALSNRDGSVLWDAVLSKYSVTDASYAMIHPRASVVLNGNLVYFVTANHQIVAFDRYSGKRVWEKDFGGTSTPIVSGNSLFLFNAPSEVVCLNASSGACKWKTEISNSLGVLEKFGMVMTKDYLISVSPSGDIYFLGLVDGKIKRKLSTSKSVTVNPIIADGVIYILSDDAELSAYK